MRRELKIMFGMFGLVLLAFVSSVYADVIICYSNSDCVSGFTGKEFCSSNNVFKNFINSSCINPGTTDSYCSNLIVPTLLMNCGFDELNSWGANYCSSGNVYHSRTGTLRGCKVINPMANISGCYSEFSYEEEVLQTCNYGCENGACINPPIACSSDSECGCNGFFGELSCSNNDVFQNFITYKCNNPGQINSYCSNIINPELKQDCGADFCLDYGNNYCRNNSVYHSRTCSNRGCNSGACFDNSYADETLVETCHHGCENGACVHHVIICSNNSDCNDNNSYTEDICLNPGAMNSSCVHNTIRCFNDLECGTNGFTINKYCINDNVYADYNEYRCLNPGTSGSSCLTNTTSKLFDSCSYKCDDGECYSRDENDFYDYEYNVSEEPGYGYSGTADLSFGSNKTNESVQKITPIVKITNANAYSRLSLNTLLWILFILVLVFLILIIVFVLMR